MLIIVFGPVFTVSRPVLVLLLQTYRLLPCVSKAYCVAILKGRVKAD